jgi:hypothetical protein
MANIEIHEFSTGIRVVGTPTQWWSTGFEGYINSTLPSIPGSVQNEISAGLFKVAEGKTSDNPALIGREVEDRGDAWSVLAIATAGKDERGRTISLYRYFLTAGLGRLPDLISWYLQVANQPVFDPFEVKQIGCPQAYNESNTPQPVSLDRFKDLFNQTIIACDRQVTPMIVHYLAKQKASNNNQLIAWAYNIEGLFKPRNFHYIKPTSKEAQKAIEGELARKNSPPALMPSGNYPVKKSIENLANQAVVDREKIQTIEDAVKREDLTQKVWKVIFDELGIGDAKNDSSYFDSNVRLYCLQGLIIPETLPELLDWLNKNKEKLDFKSPNSTCQLVRSFSKEINQQVLSINPASNKGSIKLQVNSFLGIHYLLTSLVHKPQLLEISKWLLLDSQGIWGYIFNEINYVELLNKDLEQISINKEEIIKDIQSHSLSVHRVDLKPEKVLKDFEHYFRKTFSSQSIHTKSLEKTSILNQESWVSIAKCLTDIIWLGSSSTAIAPTNENFYQKCQPLAKFFDEISHTQSSIGHTQSSSRLAALFYHLSQKSVPTDVWQRCKFDDNNINHRPKYTNVKDFAILYGLEIERDIPKIELARRIIFLTSTWVFRFVGKKRTININIFSILMYVALILLFGSILGSKFGFPFNLTQAKPEDQFKKVTAEVLNKIPEDIVKNSGKSIELYIVQNAVINTLDTDNKYKLKYETKVMHQKDWIAAIKEYQSQSGINKYGINPTGNIKSGDDTNLVLQCEVERKLISNGSNENCQKFAEYLSPKIIAASNWQKTKESVEKLRDEIFAVHKGTLKDKKKVEDAISKVLEISGENFVANQSIWTEKIKKFQTNHGVGSNSPGIISTLSKSANPTPQTNIDNKTEDNLDTYNALKCAVANELKIHLNQTPLICKNLKFK